MSSMVRVTRTEYHTIIENLVKAFGEDGVKECGSQFGRDLPHITVYLNGEAAAAIHFEDEGGNSCMRFFGTSYAVSSGYVSWRDETDHGQENKPTTRDTVTPFAVTEDDLQKPPKPRILPMFLVEDVEHYNRMAEVVINALGDKLEEVCNYDGVGVLNTCYVYNGQIIAQSFSLGGQEYKHMTAGVFTMIYYANKRS